MSSFPFRPGCFGGVRKCGDLVEIVGLGVVVSVGEVIGVGVVVSVGVVLSLFLSYYSRKALKSATSESLSTGSFSFSPFFLTYLRFFLSSFPFPFFLSYADKNEVSAAASTSSLV